jgi:sugar/nucleoside kinase (ribokinase family)
VVSASARLFCLDTVMIDIVLRISAIPESGSDVLADEHLIATGGGYNAMSAAARQGVGAVYAGRLGRGPFSSIARSSLENDHVDEPIEARRGARRRILCGAHRRWRRANVHHVAGAEASLRSADLASLDVDGGDYVLVSGYNVMYRVPPNGTRVARESGRRRGVVFDPAVRVMDIPQVNLRQVLDRADWTLCNENRSLVAHR